MGIVAGYCTDGSIRAYMYRVYLVIVEVSKIYVVNLNSMIKNSKRKMLLIEGDHQLILLCTYFYDKLYCYYYHY